LLLLYFS